MSLSSFVAGYLVAVFTLLGYLVIAAVLRRRKSAPPGPKLPRATAREREENAQIRRDLDRRIF